MTADQPSYYWYLIALLIPVIIHLFYFRRVIEIKFSNLEFLKALIHDKRNTKRLKHVIQLCLRVLFFAFLIAAFLDFYQGRGQSQKNLETVYYLDNTISLSLPAQDGKQGLNHLMEFISGHLSAGLPHSYSYLLNADFERLHKINQFNQQELLSEVTFSRQHRSLQEVIDYLSRTKREFRLYYLSDFQNEPEITKLNNIGKTRELNLVQVRPQDLLNIYVDTVMLENLLLSPAAKNELKIKFAASGKNSANEQIQFKILSDNQLLTTGVINLEESNLTVTVDIDVGALKTFNLEIDIADPEVIYDNSYYLSLPAYQKPTIVQIYDDKPNRYLTSMYGNTELFDFHLMKTDQLDYVLLGQTDLVIYDGLEKIPSFVNTTLTHLTVVIPGENIVRESYEAYIGAEIKVREEPVLVQLDQDVLEHKLFEGAFDQKTEQVGVPDARVRYQVNRYNEKVLFDAFGRNVLTRHGPEGNIYFFSTSLGASGGNLVSHSIFVPLMYGIAFRSKSFQPVYTYRLSDRYIRVPLQSRDQYSSFEIRSEQVSFVPNYIVNSEYLQIELPPGLNIPGFYQLMSEGDTLVTIALNQGKSESIMDFGGEADLRKFASAHDYVNYTDVLESREVLEANLPDASTLWRYALALAIIFLIGELLVGRYL